MGYVFYDTETTGLDAAFDQVLQFAAILTDDELNEIERFEIRSRLLPHITPSPKALQVTGISVEQLINPVTPSFYEMVLSIKNKLTEWTPSLFIGHNSIGFDEHFLRQAFYQSLLPPYLTNTDGNCRSDSLRIIQAVSLFEPDAINIPVANKKQIFKLDQVAPANGFDHPNAHDALADVEATIFICKLAQESAPDIWSNFVRFSNKSAVIDFVSNEEIFSLSDFYFGKPYSWLVTFIEQSSDQPNNMFVYDLYVEPEALMAMNDDELRKRLNKSPKPIRTIKANASPMIFPAEDAPSIAKATELSSEELNRRVHVLRANSGFLERLMSIYNGSKDEYETSEYAEKQIYDGFASNEDLEIMSKFHESDWVDRAVLINNISDSRYKYFGERLIHNECPDQMPEDLRDRLYLENAKKVVGFYGGEPWFTLPKAINDVDDLISGAKSHELSSLQDLKKFYQNRLKEADAIIQSNS